MDSQDKGAMLRGELDINEHLMAYLAYGTSRTDYRYNGSISAQILNPAGDFTTVIGQLAFDIGKQSGDAGLRGSFHTGSVGHQWAANVTHYRHTQNDYGAAAYPAGTGPPICTTRYGARPRRSWHRTSRIPNCGWTARRRRHADLRR